MTSRNGKLAVALTVLAIAGGASALTTIKPFRASGGVQMQPSAAWNGSDGGVGIYYKTDAGLYAHNADNTETGPLVAGGLIGTLTTGRIPFASSSTHLIDDSSLTYNTGTTPPELVQAGGWHSHNGGVTVRPSADNTFGAALMLDSSAHSGGDNWIIASAGDNTSYAKWLTFWDDTINVFRGGFTDTGHFIVASSGGSMNDNASARLTVTGNIAANGVGSGYYFGDGTLQTTAATGNTTSSTLTSGVIPVATGSSALGNSTLATTSNAIDLVAAGLGVLFGSTATSARLGGANLTGGMSIGVGTGQSINFQNNNVTIAALTASLFQFVAGGNRTINVGTAATDSAGSQLTINAGPAGAVSTLNGTNGGQLFCNGGNGAAASTSFTAGGGANATFQGGTGGAAAASTNGGGTGGGGLFQGGTGGVGTAGATSGNGGVLQLTGGNAGANNGGGQGTGGNVVIRGGTGSPSGTITIGATQTSSIAMGASGISTVYSGPVTMAQGFAPAYRSASSTVTVAVTDYFVGVSGSGARTVNLPAASTCIKAGQEIIVQEIGGSTGTVTINPNGTDTINGANSAVTLTTTAYGRRTFFCDKSSAWFVGGQI